MRSHSWAGMMRGIEVEGEDAFGAGGIAVDVEGDAELQQQALGGVLVAEQLAVGRAIE